MAKDHHHEDSPKQGTPKRETPKQGTPKREEDFLHEPGRLSRGAEAAAETTDDVLDSLANRGGLSLRANMLWTFLSGAVYQASQWGWLVVLARMTSQARVGQFILALSITAPVIIFSQLNLRAIQAVDARRERPFGEYLSVRILGTLAALVVIAGVSLATTDGAALAVIMLVAVAKAFESLSDVFYGLMQQNERLDLVGKARLIKGPASLVALAAVFYLTDSLFWALAAMASVWAALLLLYDIPNAARVVDQDPRVDRSFLRPRWGAPRLAGLAWEALPLGVVLMLASFQTNIPRYVVEGVLGSESLAIFGAMVYFIFVGKMLVNSVTQSAAPRLGQYYAGHKAKDFTRLVLQLAGAGAALGLAGMLLAAVAGEELLALFYGPAYAQEAQVFVWLMAAEGLGFVAMFLGTSLTAARYFRIQLPLITASVIAIAVSCLILVPAHGLLGAALGVLVGQATRVLLSVPVLVHAVLRLHLPSAEETRERAREAAAVLAEHDKARKAGEPDAGPPVSVFMTVHNGERFLAETVEAVLEQTFADFELVVVDDGSADRSLEILHSFADPRLRVLTPGRIGRAQALALAAAECRGDWIANVDADDPPHPRRLEIQLQAARAHPEFGVVGSAVWIVEGNGPVVWPHPDDLPSSGEKVPVVDVTSRLFWGTPFAHSAALIHRSAYESAGGYDVRHSSQLDYHLWIDVARAGWRLGRMEVPLQARRLHADQSYEARGRLAYVGKAFRTQVRAGRELFDFPAPLVVPVAAVRSGYSLLPRKVRLGIRGLRHKRRSAERGSARRRSSAEGRSD